MSNLKKKDKKNRFLFSRFEVRRSVLKSIYKNCSLTVLQRQKAYTELTKLPRNSSRVRFRNRCIVTGRGRFVLSSFSLSRLTLRKLAFEGNIPGIRKASW